MKKLSIAMLIPILGISLALPTHAATLAELQAQLVQLQNQLAQLNITTTTGISLLTNHNGVNIKVGSKGTRVSELQACMNAAGYNTGVVDGIYGKNTAAGVKAFQASKGLVVDGIVGAKTTPAFQVACPKAGTTTTPGAVVITPTPNTETSSNSTKEADIKSITIRKESDVQSNKTAQDIQSFTIKLTDKSGDLNLDRADITFEVTSAAGSESDLWDIIDRVQISRDGKVLGSKKTTNKSDWTKVTGNQYRVRLEGLNSKISKGQEGEFMITVDSANLSLSDLNITINSIVSLRYTDSAKVTTTKDLMAQLFEVTPADLGDLKVTTASANPKSMVITGSTTSKKTNQNLLAINVKADNTDVTLETMKAKFVTTGTLNDARDLVTKAYLYNGSKLIDSGYIASNGEITFDTKETKITKGSSKEYSIMVDLDNIDGTDVSSESTITAQILSLSGYDTQDKSINYSGTLTGNTQSYSINTPISTSPKINFVVTSVSGGASYGTATFEFNITASDNADTYISSNASDWNMNITGGIQGAFAIEALNPKIEVGSTGFKINAGTTETFIVSQVVTGTNNYAKVSIDGFNWDTDNATTAFSRTMTSGLSLFKTVQKYIVG